VIHLRSAGQERRVAWRNLRPQARRYPEIAALQDLAAADLALQELMERVVREAAGQGP
jgi:hypothetical protein